MRGTHCAFVAAVLIAASGCSSRPPPVAPVQRAAAFSVPTSVAEPVLREAPVAPPTFATLYVPAGACGELEEQSSEATTPAEAVDAVLRTRELARLQLGHTRVRVDSGSAVVDLRLREGVKGSVIGLPQCDQQALLRALGQTLRSNPQWGITRVLFLEKGSLFAM